MFCTGSSRLRAPIHRPVRGTSCIKPTAPTDERAVGLNFDSVFTITSGGLGTANLPYAVYNTFFTGHEYGQASAMGVLVVIGSIIIGTFALRVVSSLFREEVR